MKNYAHKFLRLILKLGLLQSMIFGLSALQGGMREGLDSHIAEKITINSVNQALLRWKSRKTMEEWVGKTKYAMAEYEKVKRFTFYFNENELLLISTEPNVDNEFIIKSIKKLIA